MLKRKSIILLAFLLFGIILNSAVAQPLEIWEVQGAGSSSPLEGETVSLAPSIVTARGSGFFFIQCPPSRSDNNPLTSDGILVSGAYFGSPGDVVAVSGRVEEEDGMTILGGSNLSIDDSGESQPLPDPVELDESLPAPEPSPVHSLERVEGMLVAFEAAANGPSGDFETAPLRIGAERVFREPGIAYPGLPGLPVWDGNPELFWLDPNGLSAPNNRFIETGSQVTATALMAEIDTDFWVALPTEYSLVPGPDAAPVRLREAGEYTIGSLNLLRLFEESSNYPNRLQKLSRYIGEQMRLPDILAVQEAGSLSALNELAARLEEDYPGVFYDAYLLPSNDDIKSGFLVRSYLQGVEVTQLGANEVFSFSGGLLHDRPPVLLRALLPTEPATPVQVLNLHLRSLIGIEGSIAEFVRRKRHQQSISVASMIADLRGDGNLVVLGDYNAFPFTDGYVDVYHQISGGHSLGALFPPVDITAPPLDNQLAELPARERYSFVFQGSAQALDHCLTANLQGLVSNGIQYARGNADFPVAYASNPNLPLRASDHDGLVLYLQDEQTVGRPAPEQLSKLRLQLPNPIYTGAAVQLWATEGKLRSLQVYALSGKRVAVLPLSGQTETVFWPALPVGAYVVVAVSTSGRLQRRVVVVE